LPDVAFPRRMPQRPRVGKVARACPAHRMWVRQHFCSVPLCRRGPIECAHVRTGTDGGAGIKPSDKWVVSLCAFHHREQHQIGELDFEGKHDIDLRALAREFARRSPHWRKLAGM
jgi:hypothetical protein